MLTDMQIPIIPVSDGTTQRLIANIQENTVANKDYYTGEQFILNGVLYEVTKANGGTVSVPTPAIAQGATINIASDCVVSDTITQQIKNITAGVRYKYFEQRINQSFSAGQTYNFTLSDFGFTGMSVLGFAMHSIVGDTNSDYGNTLAASPYSGNIIYKAGVSNGTTVVFRGIVFYT